LIDLNIPSIEAQVIANCDLGGSTPDPDNVIPALCFLSDLGLVVYNKPLVTLEPLWMSEALGSHSAFTPPHSFISHPTLVQVKPRCRWRPR
jgi:hypothetical protein